MEESRLKKSLRGCERDSSHFKKQALRFDLGSSNVLVSHFPQRLASGTLLAQHVDRSFSLSYFFSHSSLMVNRTTQNNCCDAGHRGGKSFRCLGWTLKGGTSRQSGQLRCVSFSCVMGTQIQSVLVVLQFILLQVSTFESPNDRFDSHGKRGYSFRRKLRGRRQCPP